MGLPAPSLADLSASQELFMTAQLVGVDLGPWPKVRAWLKRTEKALPNSWPKANATLNKVLRGREAKKAAAIAAKLAEKKLDEGIDASATATPLIKSKL
jgi:hypothetical protein